MRNVEWPMVFPRPYLGSVPQSPLRVPQFSRSPRRRRGHFTRMLPDDDRRLLAAFARGDHSAFTTLVDRHGPLVWGVCRRAARHDALAEDAFQAVFLLLARKADGLAIRTSLANWLFGVACRVAKRAALREHRRKSGERSLPVPADGSAPEADRAGPEWADTLRVLDEELAKLPPKLRGPLVACYLQGKTQDEAASDLGWTVFTLRRRLADARDLLRERLTRRGATLFTALFAGAVFAGVGFAASPPAGLPAKAVGVASGGPVPASVAALTVNSVSVAVVTAAALALAAGVIGVAAFVRFPHPTATTPTPPAAPPTTSAPPEWVTVRGRVVWPGELPKPELLNITGADKPACCSSGPVTSNFLLIHPASRGVKYAVVWLRPESEDRTAVWPEAKVHPTLRHPPPRFHELDQPNCQFEPRVIAAREGDVLTVKNSSAIPHNVTFTDRWAVDINRTLSAGGFVVAGPLSADRLPAGIRCTVHPWMSASLRVFDHPYFAVTDEQGRWEIPLAPAGRCRVVYWHEGGFHRGKAGALGMVAELKTAVADVGDVGLELPM